MRNLAINEAALLCYILERNAPGRVCEVENLRVIGRCGCGKCPTVIFGTHLKLEISNLPSTQLVEYEGRNAERVAVGLVLLTRGDRLSELEVWSLRGGPVRSLPITDTLLRMEAYD